MYHAIPFWCVNFLVENKLIDLWGLPWMWTHCFLSLSLKFFIFNFCHVKYICWYRSLCVHLFFGLCASWTPISDFSLDWGNFQPWLHQVSFLPLSVFSVLDSCNVTVSMLMLSKRFFKLFLFFGGGGVCVCVCVCFFNSCLFWLFWLGDFPYSVFQVTDHSSSFNLLLISSSVFFISVIVFFSSVGSFYTF